MEVKDRYHILINQSKISRDCIKKGYAILKMPSGKIYKIRLLG